MDVKSAFLNGDLK
jgi:hypothetical protein